jgi:hypothetical protein
MKEEIETIFMSKENVRVSVSEWADDKVWLSLQARCSSMHTTFTREEAEQLLVGLQAILAKEVTA